VVPSDDADETQRRAPWWRGPGTGCGAVTRRSVVAARLDPGTSARVAGVLEHALARPGVVGQLAHAVPGWPLPYPLLVPLALAGPGARVAVLDDNRDAWEELLAQATGATTSGVAEADVVVALRAPLPDELVALRRGSPLAPGLAARLAVACHGIAGARSALEVLLSAPGVDGERRVGIDGLPSEVVAVLAEVNAGFSGAGVDTWCVAADGAVVGIPRHALARVAGRT
jgi:alpha-D-ribose 1-methylphosphonate 5-triphosphate synthase subunit PhnH